MQATRNGKVGVICTQATKKSQAYPDAFAAAPHVELFVEACPRFVEFAERGQTSGAEVLEVAAEYLAPLQAAGVDTVVLGCTHYPLLTGVIAHVLGDEVTLVSSAEETAKDVYRVLVDSGLTRSARAARPAAPVPRDRGPAAVRRRRPPVPRPRHRRGRGARPVGVMGAIA